MANSGGDSPFQIDQSTGIVKWSLAGRVTAATLLEGSRIAAQTLKHVDLSGAIIDLTETTSFEVPVSVLKDLAASQPVLSKDIPRVVVAPRDHLYGLARMFVALSDETRPNQFVARTMQEAYDILGIVAPSFKTAV